MRVPRPTKTIERRRRPASNRDGGLTDSTSAFSISRADFIPDVEPCDLSHVFAFRQNGERVVLTLTFETMHDAHWTEMSELGQENELDNLAAVLATSYEKSPPAS